MIHHHRTPTLQLLLFIATVIGVIGVTPQSCAEQTQSPSKPNILFILADNWRWPNAGALGDPLAKTPTFDRLAREGMLFTHVFNPVPSCSPTRACLLTGKAAHQLGERANLWSGFPRDTPVVTTLLDQAGYQLGYSGKGWGPGNHEISGWQENPVGPRFESFTEFMQQRDVSRPFFYWIGNTDTATKAGKLPYLDVANASLSEDQIQVPDVLPDVPEVRRDLMNYYGGIMKLDQMATEAITALEESGLLQQTVIVYTSDNGWQMPRGLANCYDHGSRVPLVIRWPNKVPAGQSNTAMVNVADLGPTFLDIAGLAVPAQMTMRSIVPLLEGRNQPDRDAVFMERERHADVRNDHLGYPVRAIRTREHLYLRNLRPDRWPAGDPMSCSYMGDLMAMSIPPPRKTSC